MRRPERSLVDAAHDRIQRRHARHGVGEEMAGQQLRHRAEMDEARVVDLQPERLVRAIADRVRPEQAPWGLDGGPGPTGTWAEQARELGHDRPIGHLLEALIDDPETLLDLVDAQEI